MINEKFKKIFDDWSDKTFRLLSHIEVGHFKLSDGLYVTGIRLLPTKNIECHLREMECVVLENGAQIYKQSFSSNHIWLPIEHLRRTVAVQLAQSINHTLDGLEEAFLVKLQYLPKHSTDKSDLMIEDHLYENKIDMCRHILALKKEVASLTNHMQQLQLNGDNKQLSDLEIATMAAQ